MGASTTNVFLLGCRGAGKTSFMLGLSLLSRPGHDSPIRLVSHDGRTASTVTELRDLAERREWPPPTSSMTPLEFDLSVAIGYFRLSLLDYPGEDLLAAMETLDFSARKLMLERVLAADCLLVIVDPTQDLFTLLNTNAKEAGRRQDAIAQAIGGLVKHRRDNGEEAPLIALAISKADLLESAGVSLPAAVAENQALLKKLASYARQSAPPECFAISACGYGGVERAKEGQRAAFPAVAQPTGYEELFTWMKRALRRRTHRNGMLLVGGLLLLVASVVGYWFVDQKQREDRLIGQVESAPVHELHEILDGVDEASDSVLAAVDQRIGDELEQAREDFVVSATEQSLERLRERVVLLREVPDGGRGRELKELLDQIESRQEEALLTSIETAMREGDFDLARGLARDHNRRFPNGSGVDQVKRARAEMGEREAEKLRAAIRSVSVDGKDSLLSKISKIESYLEAFPDDPECARAQAGISLASRVCGAETLRLRIFRYGYTNEGATDHKVMVFFGLGGGPRLDFEAPSKGTWATADRAVQVSPPNWSSVRVEVWERGWFSDEKMASGRFDLVRDLRQFDGKTKVSLPNKGADWRHTNVWVKFKVELRSSDAFGWTQVTPEELEAYGRFVSPGDHW